MANKNKENASPHKIPRWSISTDGGILGIFLVFEAIVAGGLICFYGSKEFEFTWVFFLALGVVAGACGLILVVCWPNLRKISEWLIFTEKGRFLIFLVAEAIVVGVFFCFPIGESKNLEFTRTLILALAAVGGGYGLILAAIRSVKLSEQVEMAQEQVKIGQKQAVTGQKQLFNQQLGQGATLLASEKMPIRRTGIRVLGDLAERTIGEPEQAQLIMRTIHDFVHANACPSSRSEERLDITLGIRTLVSLYKKSGQKTELKKLVQFQGCYLAGLNFKDAELQGADFTDARLYGSDFRNAELQGVDFSFAKLNFIKMTWKGAHFIGAKLEGAHFIGAELQGAKLQGVNFKDVKLEWADCTDADFSDAKGLTENQVKGMIFKFDQPLTLPNELEQFLDPRRSYELGLNPDDSSNLTRRFVESDAEWSKKWVNEYLASIRNPKDDG